MATGLNQISQTLRIDLLNRIKRYPRSCACSLLTASNSIMSSLITVIRLTAISGVPVKFRRSAES
jgi:hypothetical protein